MVSSEGNDADRRASQNASNSESDTMKPLGELEVWFVTGSQEMYGEETLRQVAANSGGSPPSSTSRRRSRSGSSTGRS